MNNRQAYFNYHIEDKYEAGIVLLGTEVKSIREGKLSFNDAFCMFDDGELWVRGLYIAEYAQGTSNNHIAVHDRKLLLNKRELAKWQNRMKEIGLGRGKKLNDKRETIKNRDVEKEIKRYLKN